MISLYYYPRVIAPAVLERQLAVVEPTPRGRMRASVHSRPRSRIAAVATLAFGIAAEPLLRVAERASMLGG